VYEFRPGLPFEQFASVFVRHPDIALANRSVGQFEQMEQCRCFSAGGGRMVCTSCHDPHQSPAPADRDAFYRQKCMTCHESRGCSLPPPDRQAKADSCVACHMPRSASSNIVHASVTDHRVPRTPAARPASRGLPFGTPPLVRFRDGPLSPPPEERERDFGIALARFSLSPLASGLADPADIRAAAAERLKGSLARWPGDAPAWGALASVRTGRAESAEKLKAAATAAALAPESDAALTGLVEAATAAGEYDTALEAAGRLIRRDPRSTDPLLRRAFVHLAREDWVSLGADARAVLAVNPLHPEGRMCLAIAQYHQGDRAAAQREAETAVRAESDPRGQQNLRDWYRRATR
jgi:predicted CXXCH cytochrome family protein